MEATWRHCLEEYHLSKKHDVIHAPDELKARSEEAWDACKQAEDAADAAKPKEDISDERIEKLSKFTDRLPLDRFLGVFELVPSLVNVVSLCEALPHPKSVGGGKLPLDLQLIAARCSNS